MALLRKLDLVICCEIGARAHIVATDALGVECWVPYSFLVERLSSLREF